MAGTLGHMVGVVLSPACVRACIRPNGIDIHIPAAHWFRIMGFMVEMGDGTRTRNLSNMLGRRFLVVNCLCPYSNIHSRCLMWFLSAIPSILEISIP